MIAETQQPGNRKPEDEAVLIATTGAVLIVTKTGSVALTPRAMREIAESAVQYADMAEVAGAEKNFQIARGQSRIEQ